MLKKVKKWLGIEGVKLELILPEEVDLSADKLVGKIQFYSMHEQEMDSLEDKNFVLGKLVKTAKWISGIQSEYRVEAEADVLGTPLNPFDKKYVHIV